MKRLCRNVLNFATILSFALCAATIAVWVRSYRLSEHLCWANAGGFRCVSSAQGYAVLTLFLAGRTGYDTAFHHAPRYQSDGPRPPFNELLLLGGQRGDRDSTWEHAGFAWHEKRNTPNKSLHAIGVAPFWSLALITAIPPLAWTAARLWSRRRHRRTAPAGLCTACGYDLRATPQRCPECGKVP